VTENALVWVLVVVIVVGVGAIVWGLWNL